MAGASEQCYFIALGILHGERTHVDTFYVTIPHISFIYVVRIMFIVLAWIAEESAHTHPKAREAAHASPPTAPTYLGSNDYISAP